MQQANAEDRSTHELPIDEEVVAAAARKERRDAFYALSFVSRKRCGPHWQTRYWKLSSSEMDYHDAEAGAVEYLKFLKKQGRDQGTSFLEMILYHLKDAPGLQMTAFVRVIEEALFSALPSLNLERWDESVKVQRQKDEAVMLGINRNLARQRSESAKKAAKTRARNRLKRKAA